MCKDTEPRALPEDSDSPKWFDGKKVIEIAFCEEFLTRHPMCCIHGRFYTADGPIPDDMVRRLIYEELKAHAVSGVGKAMATLLDVLRMECYSPGLPLQTDRIHVANGTLFLDGWLEPAKEFCLNRLPVEYHPDAPEPKAWLRFLEELLYNEDIPTLQEYMGYYQSPSDPVSDRAGRRGQKPHRPRDASAVRHGHEHRQSEQGGDKPICPGGPGKQAGHGGR